TAPVPPLAVRLACAAITGAVVSRTTTLNEPDPVAFATSVTVQLTVVVPMAKVEPETGAQTAGIVPCSTSLPVCAKVTTAPVGPLAAVGATTGVLNVGALFVTETVNDELLWLPCASVTLQLTVVVAIGNVEPAAGAQEATPSPSTTSCVATAP